MVEIQAAFVRETKAAWCISVEEGEDIWIPKSQCENVSIDRETNEWRGDVKTWLAEQNGLV